MNTVIIRKAEKEDFHAILKLNEAEVEKTSPMDLAKITLLNTLSCFHRVAVVNGEVAAFLLVISHEADYINDNFEWFSARIPSFLYVDRIVVGSSYFGLKIGTKLYQDLFNYARELKIENITCEYNIEPLNAASQAFHNKLGFSEVGTLKSATGEKVVSMQCVKVKF